MPRLLFPGPNEAERFRTILNNALKLESDGAECTYGTHSVRKGIAAFACAGSIGGPSVVSVLHRCGWRLGSVHSRHLYYEAAGDQLLERVIAALPLDRASFAALPSHFKVIGIDVVDKVLQATYPALYQSNPIQPLLRLCLASLMYHADFLLPALPESHHLFSAANFCGKLAIKQLPLLVTVEEGPSMVSTGIPAHTAGIKRQDELLKAVKKLPDVTVVLVVAGDKHS